MHAPSFSVVPSDKTSRVSNKAIYIYIYIYVLTGTTELQESRDCNTNTSAKNHPLHPLESEHFNSHVAPLSL